MAKRPHPIPLEHLRVFAEAGKTHLDKVGQALELLQLDWDPEVLGALEQLIGEKELLDIFPGREAPWNAGEGSSSELFTYGQERFERMRERRNRLNRRILRRELQKLRRLEGPGRNRRLQRMERARILDPKEATWRRPHLKRLPTERLVAMIRNPPFWGWMGPRSNRNLAVEMAQIELARRAIEEIPEEMMSRRGFFRRGSAVAGRAIGPKLVALPAGGGRRGAIQTILRMLIS